MNNVCISCPGAVPSVKVFLDSIQAGYVHFASEGDETVDGLVVQKMPEFDGMDENRKVIGWHWAIKTGNVKIERTES
jgi:hypothetical protein